MSWCPALASTIWKHISLKYIIFHAIHKLLPIDFQRSACGKLFVVLGVHSLCNVYSANANSKCRRATREIPHRFTVTGSANGINIWDYIFVRHYEPISRAFFVYNTFGKAEAEKYIYIFSSHIRKSMLKLCSPNNSTSPQSFDDHNSNCPIPSFHYTVHPSHMRAPSPEHHQTTYR